MKLQKIFFTWIMLFMFGLLSTTAQTVRSVSIGYGSNRPEIILGKTTPGYLIGGSQERVKRLPDENNSFSSYNNNSKWAAYCQVK